MDYNALKDRILILLKNDSIDELREIIDDLMPYDAAIIFEELEDEDKTRFVRELSIELAADVLEELDSDEFEEFIGMLRPSRKSEILEEMSPDDIVDILSELPEQRQEQLISLMDVEDAEDVRELLDYGEDTAGGIMTTDFISIDRDLSLAEAIDEVRRQAEDAETIYYVYVSDQNEKLVGVVSLRELLVGNADSKIADIIHKNVISVHIDADQEEVANVVSHYNLLAVPVVDDIGTMSGIVTVDDVIDVIEDEASEDISRFVGATDQPDYDEANIFKGLLMAVKARLPWLVITLFGGLISSSIIKHYDYLLTQEVILASFMPLLVGMGGNVGTQSSTLTVRAIATGQLKSSKYLKNILLEFLIGLLMGIICGGLLAGLSMLMGGNVEIGILVGIAMCVNMLTASTIGTLVPLFFKKVGVDPAVASAPFITTTIDAVGLSIYFGLVASFLSVL